MLLLLSAVLAASPEVNLLSLEAGGAAIETPSTYGGNWSLEAALDGSPSTGWCSADGAKGPFQMTFELEQRGLVSRVEVDDTGAEEGSNPGVSAKAIEVWLSSTGPREGFALAAKLTVPRAGTATAALPKETFARWVRVIVKSNWGNARYTELMELRVLGQPLEPAARKPATGTWTLEHGPVLQLGDEGGCEVQASPPDAWVIRADTSGRVTRLTWTQVGTSESGTAAVVVTDDDVMRGAWKSTRGGTGTWVGHRRPGPGIDCRTAIEDGRFLVRLSAERRGLSLRGVSFAGDELKLEDDNELVALKRLLLSNRATRVRLMVLGKASDPAADELKRSEKRAQRVLQYLVAGGASAAQLDVGFGLLRLGSAVQLEPRVEVELEH